MVVFGPEAIQEIIDRWSPFHKGDSLITNICDIYPTLRIPMVARTKEYYIPFLGYLDRKSYQRMDEDWIYIRNHDFNETAELV